MTAQTENALLSRREIKFYAVGYDATPSRDALRAELCRKLGLSPDATIVTSIGQDFGLKRSSCVAHSYKSAADMQRLEPKHLMARISGEKKEKPKEKKAPAKKADA